MTREEYDACMLFTDFTIDEAHGSDDGIVVNGKLIDWDMIAVCKSFADERAEIAAIESARTNTGFVLASGISANGPVLTWTANGVAHSWAARSHQDS